MKLGRDTAAMRWRCQGIMRSATGEDALAFEGLIASRRILGICTQYRIEAEKTLSRMSRGGAAQTLVGWKRYSLSKTPLVLVCCDLQEYGKAVFCGTFRYFARVVFLNHSSLGAPGSGIQCVG